MGRLLGQLKTRFGFAAPIGYDTSWVEPKPPKPTKYRVVQGISWPGESYETPYWLVEELKLIFGYDKNEEKWCPIWDTFSCVSAEDAKSKLKPTPPEPPKPLVIEEFEL